MYALLSKDDVENFGIMGDELGFIIDNSAVGVLSSLRNQNYEELEYDDAYKAIFINEVLRVPFVIDDNDKDFYKFLLSGFRKIDSLNPNSQELNAFSQDCGPNWRKVFEICKNPATIMIPNEYEDCIKFAKQNERKLGINFLNDKDCFNQLNAYSWNNNPVDFILHDINLNSDEFLESILEKMSETDDEHKTLFRKLPFQKNYLTNEIVPCIDNNCYLNKACIEFPKGFNSNRILIKMDNNERIRGFQEKFMKDRLLTFGVAVKIVLEEKSPDDNYAEWIFSNMMKSSAKDLQDIKSTVSHKKWIPTDYGENCSLNEILSSNLLSDDSCDAICGTVDFYTLKDLKINDECKKFIEKKQLIPQMLKEVFYILAKKLNESREFYIPFNSYDELRSAAVNLDSSAKFPIFNIVKELDRDSNITNKELIFNDFYQKLDALKPSVKQYVEALKYLNDKEDITPGVLNLFCNILSKVIKYTDFEISSIQFPDRTNHWRNADKLAASNSDSIFPEYLLDEKVYQIIEPLIPKDFVPNEEESGGKNNLTDVSENSKIDAFFNTWRSKSDHSKLVDLALYLLRGNFRKNAETHTAEEKFSYLSTQFKYELVNLSNDYWNYGYDAKQAFLNSGYRSYFKVLIQIPEDNCMTVASLTRKVIKVSIKQSNFSKPIIFPPTYMHAENKVQIQLNKIPTDAKVSDDYAKNLIHLIFEKVYFQSSEKSYTEIERLFENFCNSSQRTIEGTKERIFDDLFGILPSLSVKTPIFEKLNSELTECYDKKTAKTYDDSKFAIERARIIRALIEKLEKSKELEEAIFEAVKEKVHMNQYMPENVLFELFQNADDCVNDLVICKRKLNNQNKKFIVKTTANKIIVSHFGRGINDTLQTENEKLQGKFHQDLLNMLSLNASDKDSADGHTGKFGLGFKSIYKVCNQPIVRSGELNFKIIAGIYPENIPAISDMNSTEGCLETRYELDKVSSVSMNLITDDFEHEASFLTLFAKQIKEIYINGKKFKMDYQEIFRDEDNSIYKVSYEREEYLLFTCESKELSYKILFSLKSGIIEDISDTEDSKLWCLTPLESVKNLPFYLNSNFNVDTGRKNLAANDDGNKQKIKKISTNFSNLLAKSKDSIGDEYFSAIYELIVHAGNMQEQTFPEFKQFAKDIINILQKKTNIIPTGWGGPLITVNDDTKLFYLPPTKYDSNVSSFAKILKPVQDFMTAISNNFFVITKSACDSLPDIIADKIKNLELDSILNFVKTKELTPELLDLYFKIADSIPNYRLATRINNLDTFKIKNEKNQWILCYNLILTDNAPKGCGINKSYSEEIISLLKQNQLFTENINKFQAEENKKLKKENEELRNGQAPDDASQNKPVIIEEVYNWWVSEKETGNWENDIKNYYEMKKFPSIQEFSITPEDLFNKQDGTIPKNWCLLLWIAAAQSMPYNWGNRDASNCNGIEYLKQKGLFDEFCNGDDLQKVYEDYLDRADGEERIRLFEMLIRIHKYRRGNNFEVFYDILKNLPNGIKNKEKDIKQLLVDTNNEELTGCGINLPSSEKTFGLGYRLIIQNLALCGFWEHCDLGEMKALFKTFRGCKDEALEFLNDKSDAKEFYACLDLPFQIYPGSFN